MDPAEAPRTPWFSSWDLGPLLTAPALLVTLPTLLKGLPDPIPTHFDALGRANGWTAQAAYPWLLFGLPSACWIFILLLGRAFVGSDQDPAGLKCRAMAPLRGLLSTGLLVLMSAGLLIPRYGLGVLWVLLAGFFGLLILGLVLMMRRVNRTLPPDFPRGLYRWGMIYVNPEDPRIWVPKRVGLGWTLNFAHRLSWVMLILLLAPVLLIIALTKAH